MSNINTVTVGGNLTRDPESKELQYGTVVNLGIAVNRSRKVDDEWINEADFFDVVVRGDFGQLIARKFQKGEYIVVTGQLRQDRWETETGDKRSKIKIIARQIDGPSLYKPASEDRQPSFDSDPPLQGEPAPVSVPVDDGIPF